MESRLVQTQELNPRSLENYVRAAAAAGLPRGQLENFIGRGYVSQPSQLPFHALARQSDMPGGPAMIALGGSRGGGKSHAVMAQVAIDDCQRVPGLKWLFLRKIKLGAAESMSDIIRKLLMYTPHTYAESTDTVDFPSNSRILIGGYKDPGDIDKYIGIEYDGIAIEDATQLSEKKIVMIRGSLRTSRPASEWIPRLYLSFNPGGIGWSYIKRTFITPWRAGAETSTRFIPSSYLDNKFIDDRYREFLGELTGDLARAWREGDLDVYEGQAFPTFRTERHVIDPFEIPYHWPRWRAIDWGYAAPFVCLWLTKNPDNGRIYVYREYHATLMTDPQQARTIKSLTPKSESISFTYADPSMWAKKSQEDIVTSTADVYMKEGVYLTKADNDRISGKRKVDRFLADLPDGKPGLLIFRNCTYLAETIPELPRDEHNPEDVDSQADDHAYDTLKYGLTNTDIMVAVHQQQQQENPWLQVKHF